MCLGCHASIDSKVNQRRAILKERVSDLVSDARAPQHWALDDGKEWMSIDQLRNTPRFARKEDVSFSKIIQMYGKGTHYDAVWAFDDSRNQQEDKVVIAQKEGGFGGTGDTGGSSSASAPTGGSTRAITQNEQWQYWNDSRQRNETFQVQREFRAEWNIDEDGNWTSNQWNP